MPILNSKLPIGISAAKHYHHIRLSSSLSRLTQHHHHQHTFSNLINQSTLLICSRNRGNAIPTHIHQLPLRSAGFTDIAPSISNSETTPGDGSVPGKSQVDELLRKRLWKLKMELENAGIYSVSVPGLHRHILCPKCRGGDSEEKSLNLAISDDGEHALWACHHDTCRWEGRIMASGEGNAYSRSSPYFKNKTTQKPGNGKKPYRVLTEDELMLKPLQKQVHEFFSKRKISVETLRRNAVRQRECKDFLAIAFTYRRDGKLVNCKYRTLDKKFWQEKNTERILYGLDDIKRASEIIIVEGEIDKLSLEEVGFLNCVSVPDGAPAKVSPKELPHEEEDKKYEYLWNCKSYLEKATRIILATDSDPPGQALTEELARRLGKERCWKVTWPKRNDKEMCKDANEVLMHLGPEALKQAIKNADFYPVQGLFNFRKYFPEIDDYFYKRHGYELGISTGWHSVDEFYKVVPGELTMITGIPNSGKSEWIDALLCNLNKNNNWKFALCSMENQVREHARKLLEKHIQKPFFDESYGACAERMSVEDLERGKRWLHDTFSLIRCENDDLPSIDWVLKRAKAAVLRDGVCGLVIDPYNELDHQRMSSQTETEYVSQILSKIKRFAQHHMCHVWFIAHPKQLKNWDGKPPNIYDISGSAHFINKCDNCIIIHRNRSADRPIDQVQVCVRKVRNKVVGCLGDAFLTYNKVTGEYADDCQGPGVSILEKQVIIPK